MLESTPIADLLLSQVLNNGHVIKKSLMLSIVDTQS